MKRILLCLTTAAILSTTSLSYGVVIFETATTPGAESPDPVRYNNWRATSFLIPSVDYTLNNVSLYLGPLIIGNTDFSVSIWSSTGSSVGSTPSALLPGGTLAGVLPVDTNPDGDGWFNYTPTGTLTLQANTYYWVVASTGNSTSEYTWHYTEAVDPTTVGETLGYSFTSDQGGAWTVGDGPNIAQIDATAVPEPHEYALIFGVGLVGFATYRRFALKSA
jgi:hypothetical protein